MGGSASNRAVSACFEFDRAFLTMRTACFASLVQSCLDALLPVVGLLFEVSGWSVGNLNELGHGRRHRRPRSPMVIFDL